MNGAPCGAGRGLLVDIYSLDVWISALDRILKINSDPIGLFHAHVWVKMAPKHYVQMRSTADFESHFHVIDEYPAIVRG